MCASFSTGNGAKTPRPEMFRYFTVGWLGMLGLALLIAVTGVRPLALVNISIVFGMVVMPLTYYPILKTASDKAIMGKHVNSRFDTIIGTVLLVLIAIAAVAAIPLMVLTHGGKP